MEKTDEELKIEISDSTLAKWQSAVDIMAKLINVPAALIMRLVDKDIEVFVSSQSSGNPYRTGDREHFLGSGLYCERVINSNDRLLIPNALEDEDWKNNPDVKLDMISYLGFPLMMPNQTPFGTICVLDSKTNAYDETYENLIKNFREIIHSELELLYMNAVLGEKNAKLADYIAEIKTLRGILPICASCKKVRDDAGYWRQIETYIEQHSEAQFSHGLCEDCGDELYGGESWYQKIRRKKKSN